MSPVWRGGKGQPTSPFCIESQSGGREGKGYPPLPPRWLERAARQGLIRTVNLHGEEGVNSTPCDPLPPRGAGQGVEERVNSLHVVSERGGKERVNHCPQ